MPCGTSESVEERIGFRRAAGAGMLLAIWSGFPAWVIAAGLQGYEAPFLVPNMIAVGCSIAIGVGVTVIQTGRVRRTTPDPDAGVNEVRAALAPYETERWHTLLNVRLGTGVMVDLHGLTDRRPIMERLIELANEHRIVLIVGDGRPSAKEPDLRLEVQSLLGRPDHLIIRSSNSTIRISQRPPPEDGRDLILRAAILGPTLMLVGFIGFLDLGGPRAGLFGALCGAVLTGMLIRHRAVTNL